MVFLVDFITMERRKILEKILPGVKWLKGYTVQDGISDLIAGITVGLTVLPQGLAYATLAGLQPQYGLYSAFVGGIVYAFIGGCRELTIGPTALLGLMVSRHTSLGGTSGADLAVLLCFLAGIMQCLMALLKLGSLVNLISMPVTVGFTSGVAFIIGSSQLKGLLGLKGGSGSGFVETIISVVKNFSKIRFGDTVLGLSSLIILLLLRKLKDVKTPVDANTTRRYIGGALWTIATARNALIVVISSIGAYYAEQIDKSPFILTGTVRSGLPDISLPPFQTDVPGVNGTLTHYNTIDMIKELGPSIALVPVIAVLGNVAISKAFGGSNISPTRELMALSLSNFIGSFVSSMPVTGSFSRSAVNHASGVRTPIGGIYTSLLVILALGVLTPYFRFIPKAALSAVIISAVIFMIEYEVVRPLWRCRKGDLLPGVITFILSLWFGVEIGLLAGVFTDLAILILKTAKPAIYIERRSTFGGIEYILIRSRDTSLYYLAFECLRTSVTKAVKEHGNIPIVLDFRNIVETDFTATRELGTLQKELNIIGGHLILLGVLPNVQTVIKEALKKSIIEATTENDIENVLIDLGLNNFKVELKDVVSPLLKPELENINENEKEK